MARDVQLALPTRITWGGSRRGAGRKRAPGRRPGVAHIVRPVHHAAHPVLVTLRAAQAIRCLRSDRVFVKLRRCLAISSRDGFRILEFSVQDDHVHLIGEAADSRTLSSGIRGLAIRVARAVNRSLGRRGRVWGDRFHARALTSPRAVRHALVYVLMNDRKHHGRERGLDPCSSAPWFRGWRERVEPAVAIPPVVTPRTWLAAVGWRRHGLIDVEERPRAETTRRTTRRSPSRPAS